MFLEVTDICYRYEEKWLLNGISFSLKRGEIVSVVGSSGSGKTTLFRIMTNLLKPDYGSVCINNKHLPKAAEEITYMQQEDLLLPWRSAIDNIMLVSELGQKKGFSRDEALNLLKKVGLKGFENHFPHELSGGMRHRVSLARALMQKRPLLLLDEPFGSLDVILREELYLLLRDLAQSENMTVLFVTHDFRDAIALSDRILVLSKQKIYNNIFLSQEIKDDPVKIDKITQDIKKHLLE